MNVLFEIFFSINRCSKSLETLKESHWINLVGLHKLLNYITKIQPTDIKQPSIYWPGFCFARRGSAQRKPALDRVIEFKLGTLRWRWMIFQRLQATVESTPRKSHPSFSGGNLQNNANISEFSSATNQLRRFGLQKGTDFKMWSTTSQLVFYFALKKHRHMNFHHNFAGGWWFKFDQHWNERSKRCGSY